jgi:antirestriction protein ArdC
LSVGNYPAIFAGFTAKGSPESEIRPRENVFTYQAWRALGRQVRRGEHGVKVVTFVPMTKENKETGEKKPFRWFWATTVFHISQTDAVETPHVHGGAE